MISRDALQVGFLSSLTIVLKNDHFYKRAFWKTIVLKTTIFKNELLKKAIVFKTVISFSIFRRRFHNETIVLQKNENVNIPIYRLIIQ